MVATSRSFGLLWAICLAACVFTLAAASPAPAGIVFTGEVVPSSPDNWWSGVDGYIAKTSGLTGSAVVDGGSGLASKSGYLAYSATSTGTATVTGTGSTWTNSSGLNVGYAGSGTLTIAAGGQVSSTDAHLGFNSGSIGRVTVTGTGSKWTNTGGEFMVGLNGSGTLTIEAGGQVSNTTAYLGTNSGSTGTATVTGTGSMWINSGDLYVSREGTSGTLRR